VEVAGGPTCGNCRRYDRTAGACAYWAFMVDAANGCCDDWVAKRPAQARDWRADARRGVRA